MSSKANGQGEQHQGTPTVSKARTSYPEQLIGVGAWIGEVATRSSSTSKSQLPPYDSQTVSLASELNLAALDKTMPKYDPVAQFCMEAPRESAQVVTWAGSRNRKDEETRVDRTSR